MPRRETFSVELFSSVVPSGELRRAELSVRVSSRAAGAARCSVADAQFPTNCAIGYRTNYLSLARQGEYERAAMYRIEHVVCC